MAHVIGLPLSRGNSDIYKAVKLDGDLSAYFEGQAVSWSGLETVTNAATAGKVVGFVIDINRKSGFATLVQAANDVMLPVTGSVTAGTAMAIDPTSKKVCAPGAGKIGTNGMITGPAAMAYDGKSGALVNCARVRFGMFEDQGALAATMAAPAEAKAAK